jgi:hypothetical protein
MKRLLIIGFLIFLTSCSQSNVQSNILLVGEQEVTVLLGTNYVDLGVVAIEGDSFLEVVVQGQVDTSRLGVYIILYEATDSSGKKLSLTRKVTVVSELQGSVDGSTCDNPNGDDPCWNEASQSYLFEPGAKIVIGVENLSIGEELLRKWRRDYPNHPELFDYLNFSSISTLSGERLPDVALMNAVNVIGNEKFYVEFDQHLAAIVQANSVSSAYDYYNQNGTFISPAFWNGMVFSWNQTMLESFDIDVTTDSNNDGLPDAIDTWEKIFELNIVGETYKNNRINEIYPITLDEPFSAYSNLTAGGFDYYQENSSDPGFGSVEFLNGLRFIETFSKLRLNQDEFGNLLAGNRLGWRWEGYHNQEAYPFALVGTWMDIPQSQTKSNSIFRVSKMPTYKGNQLRPFASNIGYVINEATRYPSAAHEVVRWLNQKDTIELMVQEFNYTPAMNSSSNSLPTNLTRLQREFIVGMAESYIEPITSAMNVYYNIGVSEVLKDLWDGKIPPEDAQAIFIQKSNAMINR